jgi:biopolymer transport protein ExbB
MMALGVVTLAQDAANPIVAGGQLHSVWDFIVKGGPAMGAIIACSLVALAVIVERAVVLRRMAIIPPGFLEGLEAIGGDRQRALAYCEASGSPAGAILAAAIRRRGHPEAAVEKAVEDAGRRELMRLRKRVRLLGVLPQVSTMLGLLGTIFGMIKTFQAIATSGQALGKTELLAKGIFEAWTCTAAGLLVAIPVMIAYHVVLGRIDGMIVDLDKLAVDFVAGEHARASRPASSADAVHESAPDLAPAGAV